jgi:predicted DNA-binding protein with PD1-like motif
MKSKWISKNPKTLAVVFEEGDELVAGLDQVAAEFNLAGSHFTGIGACRELTTGFFVRETKEYQRCVFREQMEVLSLTGDIAIGDKGPVVHAHVVAGRADGTAHGGHLMHGIVWPTMEVIIIEAPKHLHRKYHPDLGLSLINL